MKDDLLAGRTPPPQNDGRPTIAHLVNSFLTFERSLVNSGELTQRTWDSYHETGQMPAAFFGHGRVAEDLTPADFQSLRASMAKRWKPVRLGNQI